MRWFLIGLKKSFDFSGRARRKEFWFFYLFSFLFSIVAAILDLSFDTMYYGDYGLITIIYTFAVFLPSISVSVRRFHDLGMSGWNFLISLVPIFGFIWFFITMCGNGNAGENKYGPNPKEIVISA